MTETPGKNALLAHIDSERTFWEQLVAEVGEEHMLEPGATGHWTFKDVVAHLSGWRANTLARLDAAVHGHAPAAPPWPAHLSEEDDFEAINAWIYQTNRERPLREVLDEYQGSFVSMRDAVNALDERDLTEPGRYDWLKGVPLANVIMASFGHLHEEHEATLRDWLDRRTHIQR
ncbi:MAG TPA: ClbS/DfsB family four-helix bundle protein [Roseiflexaceae bacterium]|nr:ClbS/DfsB family four-helix bundle protein [Roseiflexaceae bacterium]